MADPIDLHEVAEREREERFRTPWRVKVCNSTACASAGSRGVLQSIREVAEETMPLDVTVIPTGCMGLCSAGPLIRMMRLLKLRSTRWLTSWYPVFFFILISLNTTQYWRLRIFPCCRISSASSSLPARSMRAAGTPSASKNSAHSSRMRGSSSTTST